jgi:hypothetical protein
MVSRHWYHKGHWRRVWGTLMAVVRVSTPRPELPPVVRVDGKSFKVNK